MCTGRRVHATTPPLYYQTQKVARFCHTSFISPFPCLVFYLFIYILGPHLQHMEVPMLGVQSDLQLPAYTRACSNPGSLTYGLRPGIEPERSRTLYWVLYLLSHTGNSLPSLNLFFFFHPILKQTPGIRLPDIPQQ